MMESEDDFQKRLEETFKGEASEHLSTLTHDLLELEKDYSTIGTKDFLEKIFREMHSLKGAARSVGKDVIQNICQAFEDVLAALVDNQIEPTEKLFEVAFGVLDLIPKLLESTSEVPEDPETYTQLIDALHALCQQKSPPPTPLPKCEPKEASPPQNEEAPPAHQVTPQAIKPNAAGQSFLKISSAKMDALISQIEELTAVKSMYATLRQKLQHLLTLTNESDKLYQAISVSKQYIKHRLPSSAPYYERANLLVNQTAESINETLILLSSTIEKALKESQHDDHIINSMTTTLLDDTKRLLMQPFSTLLEPFPKMVRDISKKLEKEVELHIEGKEVEIDRRILAELKDPLIHLVRNSIDHGIELPEVRKERGKPSVGTISIVISEVGSNRIDLLLADDGGGFPLEKIKQKAIKKGLLSTSEAKSLSEEEVIKLAMHAGVSSAEMISELSGRGIGLGVMVENIEKMGGSFSIHTNAGEGTKFNISLPLTRATFRGLQVATAGQQFIMPTQNISRILRQEGFEWSTVEERKVVLVGNKHYPYKALHELIGLSIEQVVEPSCVLLVLCGSHEIAIGIDKLIQEQEVFIKGLGKTLQNIPNFSSATILEGGKIIPILDGADLVQSMIHSSPRQFTSSHSNQETNPLCSTKVITILLAEDTATTALLFRNILENAGYNVIYAEDGAKALEAVKKMPVDLIITDIEMPNMNGFELIEHVHQIDTLKDVPIIIITALESRLDKERGIELGANAYIEKSRFLQNELLSIVRTLL